MNLIKQVSEVFLNLLFPRRCPLCDGPVKPFGALICDACENKVVYNSPPFCMKCGKNLADGREEYCLDCTRKRHLFDRGYSLFAYRSVADSLYRFKYKGRQEYGAYYGERMYRVLGKTILSLRPQAIIPVPIHSSRKKMRGYNQAEIVAKVLGEYLDIPVETELIVRCKKTKPLKDLTPSERQNNLKKAFKIKRNDVKLKTIVILDDIYTTGSTVDEISALLRAVGVEHIYVLTLAIGKGL